MGGTRKPSTNKHRPTFLYTIAIYIDLRLSTPCKSRVCAWSSHPPVRTKFKIMMAVPSSHCSVWGGVCPARWGLWAGVGGGLHSRWVSLGVSGGGKEVGGVGGEPRPGLFACSVGAGVGECLISLACGGGMCVCVCVWGGGGAGAAAYARVCACVCACSVDGWDPFERLGEGHLPPPAPRPRTIYGVCAPTL